MHLYHHYLHQNRFILTVIILLFGLVLSSSAQKRGKELEDSLLQAYHNSTSDTGKINILFSLINVIGDFKEYEKYNQLAEALTKNLSTNSNKTLKEFQINSTITYLNNYANNQRHQGNFHQCILYQDSALVIATRSGNKILEAKALDNLGSAYFSDGQYDIAIERVLQSKKLNQELNNQIGISSNFYLLGNCYRLKGNYTEAFSNLLASIELKKDLVNEANKLSNIKEANAIKRELVYVYRSMSRLFLQIENFDKAISYNAMGMNISKEMEDENERLPNLRFHGNLYYNKHDYDSALIYYYEFLKIARQVKNKWSESSAYEDLGYVYLAKKEYQKSLELQISGLGISIEINDEKGIADSYYDIAMIYLEMGKESPNYLDSSLYNFNIAKTWYTKIGNHNESVDLQRLVGELYFLKGQFGIAKQEFLHALETYQRINAKSQIQSCYSFLAKCDSAIGNLRAAYQFLSLSTIYTDSINKEKYNQAFQNAQFNYETQKIEKLLNEEHDKKEAIAMGKIQQQRIALYLLIAGLIIVSGFFITIFRQRNRIKKEKENTEKEKQRSETLLLNILPQEVAEELKNNGSAAAKDFELVTVLFTDFVGFTQISEKLSPAALVNEINYCFSHFDHIAEKYKIEKIKTIGDAYMCAGGLPVVSETHAEDIIRAALEIRDFMLNHQKEKLAKGEVPFEIRIGIHTGPVVAGIVGVKKFAYDIWGDTVNLASRMESSGESGKINISETTYEFIKDKFICKSRGKIMAKNKGELQMYFVENEKSMHLDNTKL